MYTVTTYLWKTWEQWSYQWFTDDSAVIWQDDVNSIKALETKMPVSVDISIIPGRLEWHVYVCRWELETKVLYHILLVESAYSRFHI